MCGQIACKEMKEDILSQIVLHSALGVTEKFGVLHHVKCAVVEATSSCGSLGVTLITAVVQVSNFNFNQVFVQFGKFTHLCKA